MRRVDEHGVRSLQSQSRAPHADQHTRFLLTCHGLASVKGEEARAIFERTFREYGLPRAIRTDNGAPFVIRALYGLSHLNVWWMRLGIQHRRIHPVSPQENGAHEHRCYLYCVPWSEWMSVPRDRRCCTAARTADAPGLGLRGHGFPLSRWW